jgi:ubiquinone/menaquinone biosynthesis C-methylase UbiE
VTPSVESAYDAIAPEYDRQLEGDAWMRGILWKYYREAFRPGHHVLDVGCGTGTDALFLARHGIRVTGIDISPGMVAQAQSKLSRHGLSHRVRLLVLDIADLQRLPANHFDGIIATFASLNTSSELTTFAAEAARLLQPSGRMILHLLNRSSLWEWAGLIKHGRWAEARQLKRRRERTFLVGSTPVHHYLPRAYEAYARDFSPYFRLCRTAGLGIVRPPCPVRGMPGTVLAALTRLDELIGTHEPFMTRGRFMLLDLVRDSRPPADERVRHTGHRGP